MKMFLLPNWKVSRRFDDYNFVNCQMKKILISPVIHIIQAQIVATRAQDHGRRCHRPHQPASRHHHHQWANLADATVTVTATMSDAPALRRAMTDHSNRLGMRRVVVIDKTGLKVPTKTKQNCAYKEETVSFIIDCEC